MVFSLKARCTDRWSLGCLKDVLGPQLDVQFGYCLFPEYSRTPWTPQHCCNPFLKGLLSHMRSTGYSCPVIQGREGMHSNFKCASFIFTGKHIGSLCKLQLTVYVSQPMSFVFTCIQVGQPL